MGTELKLSELQALVFSLQEENRKLKAINEVQEDILNLQKNLLRKLSKKEEGDIFSLEEEDLTNPNNKESE